MPLNYLKTSIIVIRSSSIAINRKVKFVPWKEQFTLYSGAQ